MKLCLNKKEISNLSKITGGNDSDLSACIYCVDMRAHSDIEEECEESANCGTAGYMCGNTGGLNCKVPTNPESPCPL